MIVTPVKTRIFRESEDLIVFITKHIPKVKEGTILAVTSKIVALSEGRTVVVKSEKEKEKVIRSESEWAIQTLPDWWLTIRDGMFTINAGIDKSNADGKIVLLPKDNFKAAERIRAQLKRHYKVRKFGIIITDSRVAPLRRGVFGVALGYAGFKGLRDYRGKPDIFGRKLRFTQVNISDALASAAALEMGEGSERQPLAVIENAPVQFTDKVNRRELRIPPNKDIFERLFRDVLRK
ncbi:hypothetical protein C4585_01380 [Candidatus Parcubacteria bacterium]|nr:MAG: hypothetical protein C4585_01380 [Candidatus Parcubacteria bacterium]